MTLPLREQATAIILSSCQRRDAIREYVWDAGLMQGASGTALIYLLAYACTGREEMKHAAEYWIEDILHKKNCDEGCAGFFPYDHQFTENSTSFIHGTSGIGLFLISVLTRQLGEWKNWLML